MKEQFREALIQHIKVYHVNVAEMARRTGVSKELIHSLRQRKTVCPNVDDAMKLSAYFGKSVEEFIETDKDSQRERLIVLAAQLSEEDRGFVEELMKLLVSRRRQTTL